MFAMPRVEERTHSEELANRQRYADNQQKENTVQEVAQEYMNPRQ